VIVIGPTSPLSPQFISAGAEKQCGGTRRSTRAAADGGLHGPVANESPGPNLTEFEHAQRGFVRAKLTRNDGNEEQQGCPHQSERRHGSYRTV